MVTAIKGGRVVGTLARDAARLASGGASSPLGIIATLVVGMIIGVGIAGAAMLIAGPTARLPVSALAQRPVTLGSLGTCEVSLSCVNDPSLAAGWKPFCDQAKDDASCAKYEGCTWVPSSALSNPLTWPIKRVCWPLRPGTIVQRLSDRTYVVQDAAGNLLRVRNYCR